MPFNSVSTAVYIQGTHFEFHWQKYPFQSSSFNVECTYPWAKVRETLLPGLSKEHRCSSLCSIFSSFPSLGEDDGIHWHLFQRFPKFGTNDSQEHIFITLVTFFYKLLKVESKVFSNTLQRNVLESLSSSFDPINKHSTPKRASNLRNRKGEIKIVPCVLNLGTLRYKYGKCPEEVEKCNLFLWDSLGERNRHYFLTYLNSRF